MYQVAADGGGAGGNSAAAAAVGGNERDVAADGAAGHLAGVLGTDAQRATASGTGNFNRHR
jgi:hypothetical protein